MCGRYASTRSPQDLAQLFQVAEWHPEETLAPSWNERGSPTAVTCPNVGEGLFGYAPEPKFALRVSTFS